VVKDSPTFCGLLLAVAAAAAATHSLSLSRSLTRLSLQRRCLFCSSLALDLSLFARFLSLSLSLSTSASLLACLLERVRLIVCCTYKRVCWQLLRGTTKKKEESDETKKDEVDVFVVFLTLYRTYIM
jgi:hypothetical protein